MSSCLFIDAENIRITEEDLLYILMECPIHIIFIYFDMEKNNLSQHYIDWIYKYNCFLINVPSIGGKNSVDLQMSIDITEWAIKEREMKNIIIASNDRDFYPLCATLKKYKKNITIIAYQKISEFITPLIDSSILLFDIPSDIKIIIHCFLLERKSVLSFTYIKKLLKKINKKKKMQDFKNLMVTLGQFENIFTINDHDIKLSYSWSK